MTRCFLSGCTFLESCSDSDILLFILIFMYSMLLLIKMTVDLC